MSFKNVFAKAALLIISLFGLSTVTLAQGDTFIFNYSFSAPGFAKYPPNVGLTLHYADGTTELLLKTGMMGNFSQQVNITKVINEIAVQVSYNAGKCKDIYSGTAHMGGPYGYKVVSFQTPGHVGSNCEELPGSNEVDIHMSLLPLIRIVNPDRSNAADNVYCDNQPVHLKVDYFAHQLDGAYWQYRVDNGSYYPLKLNTAGGVWDPTNNIQGNDISFTLRDIFGANYAQYLNRRIEFRAVHAQQFNTGYWEGDGVQRHVDGANDGSNSFTYIFYPSTLQPVQVRAINPPCSNATTNGIDIQFERALLAGEVVGPISVFNKSDGAQISQYPSPLSLDASNTIHLTDHLAPGNYYFTMEGSYLGKPQCNKVNYDFSVSLPQPVTFTVDSKKDVSCFGESNGAITLKGDGGAGGYAYSIDNGVNWSSGTNTITGLAKGSYTIIARDTNNCPAVASQTANIDQPAAALTAGISGYNDPTAATRNDGAINISVGGGSTPYTYLWNNGATTQNISGLGSGTYIVTVTDAHSCTVATDSLALVAPPPITVDFAETPVSCYGRSDGGIQATVKGGQKPYTYSWSNGNRTNTVANLPAGHYTLKVTDANNVDTLLEYDLTQPVVLEIVPTVTPVTCNAKTDGAITTVVSGGTTPYTYRWNNGATTSALSQLPAGNYHLSVTDARNCPATMDTAVLQPAALNISGIVTPPTRFGAADAEIDVTVSGGTTPYSYSWNNGATTEDLEALADGDYTLSVTDKNNCPITKDFTVDQPGPLVVSITKDTAVSCYGSATGALTAHVSGGVGPYIYQWSNGGTTAALTRLPAGYYKLTVTDRSGVIATADTTLTEPPALKLSVTGSEINCAGGLTGTVTSAASGGTLPYTYRWNTGATTPNLSGVGPGLYTLLVTDANKCGLSGNGTVNGAGALAITAVTQAPTCNGDNDGFIELQVSGGRTPYTYSWSNGAATKDLSNLPAGTYTIQLTDSKNCGFSQSYTLDDPAPLQMNLGIDRTLCAGQSVVLDATIAGGVLYSWSGPDGFTANTAAINVSTGGNYTAVAVDGHSCQATDEIAITQDAREIFANFLVSTDAFTGDTVVAVNVTEQAVDQVEWLLPAGAKIISQSNNLVELRFDQPGNYALTLATHLGNCQTSASRSIMILASSQLPGVNTPHTSLFVRTTLRPNPNSGQFYVDVLPTADASVNYRFLDAQRNRVILEQKGQLTKDVLNTQAFNIPNLPAGVYVLLVESSLETKALKVLIL